MSYGRAGCETYDFAAASAVDRGDERMPTLNETPGYAVPDEAIWLST